MTCQMYSTTRWKNMRARQLRLRPLCVYCSQQGHVTPATVADHVIPHRGNPELFYDARNLQSLCASCHSGTKQRLEKSGSLRGSSLDGLPLDPCHPWYKEGNA